MSMLLAAQRSRGRASSPPPAFFTSSKQPTQMRLPSSLSQSSAGYVCVGLKKGGVLTVVRPEVELLVNAMEIPSSLEVDIKDFEVGDTITISSVELPSGTETTIKGRDFVIANIQAPSSLKSSETEESAEENEEGTPEEETKDSEEPSE